MKHLSEGLIGVLLVSIVITACVPKSAAKTLASNDSITYCAKGSTDDSNCQLDPSDCSRGIDESNQEECAK